MFVTHRGSLKGIIRSQDLTTSLPLFYDVQREAVNNLTNVFKRGGRQSYTSLKTPSETEEDEVFLDEPRSKIQMVERRENDGDAGAGNLN